MLNTSIVPYGLQHMYADNPQYLRERIHSFGETHDMVAQASFDNAIDIRTLWEVAPRVEMWELCESLLEECGNVARDVESLIKLFETVRDQHPGCRASWQPGYIVTML